MNKTLRGKVTELENNVLQPPKPGSTKICTCGFPEPERVLLEQARQLAELQIPYDQASRDQIAILEKAAKILNFRIFDLFISSILEPACHDDPVVKVAVHERFLWFIREIQKEIKQQLKASEIERNTPDDCEVDKVDEYFRSVPEPFTPDSYDKLQSEIMVEWLKQPGVNEKLEKRIQQ